MNIIEHGDYKKAVAKRRRKDFRRFRCQICGALWDASISKKECRIVTQDYNDDHWVSDCPEEYCDGIGKEEKGVYFCNECRYFTSPSTCLYRSTISHIENPAAAMTCGHFTIQKREEEE